MDENPPNNEAYLTREEWTEKMAKAIETVEQIMDELDRLHGKNWLPEWTKIKSAHEAKILQTGMTNPELREYAMYFVSIAGSTFYERSPKFDLPGDLSIFDYFQKVLEELKAKPSPA